MFGSYEFELNGVAYNLAPTERRYTDSGEPLRPPNGQTLQGATNVFQLRPDLLRWRVSDWSGGQGQYAYDGHPDGGPLYWKGFFVDGFTRYGTISPGWGGAYSETQDNHQLAVVGGTLYAVDTRTTVGGGTDYQRTAFGTWTSTGADVDGLLNRDAVVGDGDNLYVYDGTAGKIYRANPTDGTSTEIATNAPTVTNPYRSQLLSFGDFLFLVVTGANNAERGVWQASKAASSPLDLTNLQIYDMSGTVGSTQPAPPVSTVGPNRLFVATPGDDGQSALIHEITPDDSSATGFGYVRATVPGVYPDSMWYSNGFIWLAGRINENTRDTNDDRGVQLVYLDLAQGTYGSVNSYYRDADDEVTHVSTSVAGATTGALSHIVTSAAADADDEIFRLFQIDQATGGVQNIGLPLGPATSNLGLNGVTALTGSPIAFDKGLLLQMNSDNHGGILEWNADQLSATEKSYFITSWYEFGVADEKSLSSVELTLRKGLPANWDINVYYQADNDDGEDISTWTQIGTSWNTDTETNKTFPVSSSVSQVTFNRIRFAIEFDGTAGGITSKPELTTFEATAQAALKFRVRELWLLVDDEKGPKGRDGSTQISNIKTVGDLGTVVEFKDGMVSSRPNVWESSDVIVDGYQIHLERPGEGVAWVRLLESYS